MVAVSFAEQSGTIALVPWCLARTPSEGGIAMAIGVQLEFSGATLDQYDRVIQKMGFTPGGSGAPGGLFHWVTKTADGFRVIDVWESRQQFERFSKEKIGPLAAEVGFPGQPRITFFEVHNFLTKG
jgi:hypothetical protein